MLYRDIVRTLAHYLWIMLIPLLIPFGIAIYCDVAGPTLYPQPSAIFAFFFTMLITAATGALLWWLGRGGVGRLYRREGLLLVILIYLITPIIGGLPFYLNRTFDNPIDAYFEAVSGLTTTGATIIEGKRIDPSTGADLPLEMDITTGEKTTHYTYYGTVDPVIDPETKQVLLTGVEAINPALVFWRSFMQWLGGGGVIVLFVAILPALGVGGKILFQMELSGPSKESIFPRIKETASQLWKVYLSLTIAQIFLLMVTNERVSLFDAITVSFSTLSTGGFTPKNTGIQAYQSAATDWVVIAFMILGSISFALYFFCMRGRFSRLKDPELRVFLLIILFAVAITTWQLIGHARHLIAMQGGEGSFHFFEALRYGAFQVISVQTSTGFSTANYDLWPFSIQTLMLILMFVGGMAGSTAGGIKVIRQQTFFRIMLNKIESIYRPDIVRTYRVGNATIDNRTATTVLCFIMVAASLTIIGTFLLVLDGVDPESALTGISCMINNVGIAFRAGGPTSSFAFLSNFGKLLSCIWMIAGRLEFFALLIAFVPAFWRTSY